ncbi:hypothetical protein D9758_013341 [Tetrapyrgos nigripes]|uniref:Uncharacterized protein n=1 Tax=Tetrapyrgos nigripes TaxID=182062 RepID=A0A8H5CL47_9AGAR|nr:hypothetical protein D9758_013341 [Tetrapyrgos nigripes]
MFRLIGVPAPNDLIPQAPIHITSLVVLGRLQKEHDAEEDMRRPNPRSLNTNPDPSQNEKSPNYDPMATHPQTQAQGQVISEQPISFVKQRDKFRDMHTTATTTRSQNRNKRRPPLTPGPSAPLNKRRKSNAHSTLNTHNNGTGVRTSKAAAAKKRS